VAGAEGRAQNSRIATRADSTPAVVRKLDRRPDRGARPISINFRLWKEKGGGRARLFGPKRCARAVRETAGNIERQLREMGARIFAGDTVR